MRNKLLKCFILFGFSIFLFFVLFESGLRIYYFVLKNRTTIVWKDDSYVGRRLLPSQSGWFISNTHEYKTWITVNTQGWRDSEHTIEKPSDTYRILVLGDSFVENFQVPLRETFFKQIEDNLKIPGKKLEVVALGLGDTGTAQQYLILKKYGLSYHPDLVVHLFFSANDIKNNSLVLQMDQYRPYFKLEQDNTLKLQPFVTRSSLLKYKLLYSLKEKSVAAEFLLNLKGQLFSKISDKYPIDYGVYETNFSKDYSDAWQVTKQLIIESKKETEKIGAKYVLVTLANNEQINDDLWHGILKIYPALSSNTIDIKNPDNLLNNFCSENSISCLFMYDYFKNYTKENPGKILNYKYDGHWNNEGTNLAAKFLIENLSKFISQ